MSPGVRLLGRSQVLELLPLAECVDAVETAFRAHAEGKSLGTLVAGFHVHEGGFHLKAAGMAGDPPWFAAKLNANFPGNPERNRQPTIQGLVLLADARTGRPLAVLDSAAVTLRRTAAATAVAARRLAGPDATVATVVGCGVQGPEQVRALAGVLPLERVYLVDRAAARAEQCARELTQELGLPVAVCDDLTAALRQSLVIVTCTPATRPLLEPGMLRPGTFVAAVGADNESKNEIHPALLAQAVVVTDLTEQAARIGDLHHALVAGTMGLDRVHAELAEVLSGRRPGRQRPDDIVVFDSTGTALQDVAAAAVTFCRAQAAGVGPVFDFGR